MKNLIIITSIQLTILVLTGCGVAATSGDLPTLDLAAAIDNPKTFDLAEIAESIEYIPLDESRPEALVGDIYMMEESRTGFYLADLSDSFSSAVKYFDRSGRYVAQRGRIGRGPEEYAGVSWLTVDWEGDVVYISGSGWVAYDAAGRMTARNDDMTGSCARFFDGRLVKLNYPLEAPEPGAGPFTLVDVYTPDLRHETSIDVPSKGRVAFPVNFQVINSNGAELAIKEELSDTLYHYRAGRLEPAATMGMGRYAFPREMFDMGAADRWAQFYRVIDVHEGGRWTVVRLQNGLMGDIHWAVVDGRDPSGAFTTRGPDDSPGLFIDGVSFHAMYVRDGRLVGYVNALDIVDAAESGKITRPDLADLAATLRDDSNPVIVIADLKK